MPSVIDEIFAIQFQVKGIDDLKEGEESIQKTQNKIAQLRGRLAGLKDMYAAIKEESQKAFVATEITKAETAVERLSKAYSVQLGTVKEMKITLKELGKLRDNATDAGDIIQYNASIAETTRRLKVLQGEYARESGLIEQLQDKLRDLQAERKRATNPAQINAYNVVIGETKRHIKDLQTEYRGELGLIEGLQKELSALAVARKKALSKDEIANYDVAIKEKKAALAALSPTTPKNNGGGVNALSLAAGAVGGAVGFAAAKAVDFLTGLPEKLISTTKQFEKFESVLTNTLGSKSEAQATLENLSTLAANFPVELTEITDGFIKLANNGFKPTNDELTKMIDLASSRGKSFDQLVEGILDAETFQFERLKEFGIRATQTADKITFTFKGQPVVVEKSAEAVRKYILSLGSLSGVGGTSAAVAKTLGGAISNAKDQVELLVAAIGDRLGPVLKFFVQGFTSVVSVMREFIAVPFSEKVEEQKQRFGSLVSVITDVTTAEIDRKNAMQLLNAEFPDLLKNIDTEKLTNTELIAILQQVNTLYDFRANKARNTEKLKDIQSELNTINAALSDKDELERQAQQRQLASGTQLKPILLARRKILEEQQSSLLLSQKAFGSGEIAEKERINNKNLKLELDKINGLKATTKAEADAINERKAILQKEKEISDIKQKLSFNDKNEDERARLRANETTKQSFIERGYTDARLLSLKEEAELRAKLLALEAKPKERNEKAEKKADDLAEQRRIALREAAEAVNDLLVKEQNTTNELKAAREKGSDITKESIKAKYEAELKTEIAAIEKKEREIEEKLKVKKLDIDKGTIKAVLSPFGTIKDAAKQNNLLRQEADEKERQRLQKELIEKLDAEIVAYEATLVEARAKNVEKTLSAEILSIERSFYSQIGKLQSERDKLLKQADSIQDVEKRESEKLAIYRNYSALITEVETTANTEKLAKNIEYAEKYIAETKVFFDRQKLSNEINYDNELVQLDTQRNAKTITEKQYNSRKAQLGSERVLADLQDDKFALENQKRRIQIELATEEHTDDQKIELKKKVDTIDAELAKNQVRTTEEKNKQIATSEAETQEAITSIKENALKIAIGINELLYSSDKELLDRQIALQERRVTDAARIAEKGNADAYNREKSQLDKLIAAKEAAAKREQRINAIIAAGQSILVVSNAAVAFTQALKDDKTPNIFVKIAGGITLAAAIIGSLAAIKKATSGYEHGTRSLDGQDVFKGENDSLLIRAQRGERIVPKEQNRRFFQVYNYLEEGNIAPSVAMQRLKMQESMKLYQRPNHTILKQKVEESRQSTINIDLAKQIMVLKGIESNIAQMHTDIVRNAQRGTEITNVNSLAAAIVEAQSKQNRKWNM